jgi:hypothetical protein
MPIKKKIFSQFLCVFLFESYVHLHYSLKIKIHKETKNSKNQGFSSFCCLLMEGSGAGSVQIYYGTEAKKSTDPYTAAK